MGIAGGLVATMIAFLIPRPYLDAAVVEIGQRSANEPLENPILAGFRIRGGLLEAANDLGVQLESSIVHRREEKTNELTRFMDIRVMAETASTARTILDRGLNRLTADHRAAHAYERDVLREHLEGLEQMAAALDGSIREAPSVQVAPGHEMASRAELDALNARLFEVVRSSQVVRSLMSDVRTPPTRVIARQAKVEQVGMRTKVWIAGGLLLGLILGVSLAALRSIRESKEPVP